MYCCTAPSRATASVPDYDKTHAALPGTTMIEEVVSHVADVATRIAGNSSVGVETSRGSEVKKMRLPIVAVFPAASRPGIACIRALASWPTRRKCAKITCVVKDENDIHKIREALGASCVDALSFSFASLGDIEAMTQAFVGCDRVFIASHQSPNYATLGIQACEAAKEAGVEHFIFVSFCGAEQEATAMTKAFRQVENHVQAKIGMKYTILRTLFFMENLLRMDKELRDEGRLYGNWGGSQFAPVSIEDLGRTAAAILSDSIIATIHHGKTYNITGPTLLTGVKMAEIVGQVLGKRIQYLDIPKEDMSTRYRNFGVDSWLINLLVENNEFYKTGALAFVSTDVATITNGNHTSFESFMRFYKWKLLGMDAPIIGIFPGTGKVGTAILEALLLDSGIAKVRVLVREGKHKSELEDRYKDESLISIQSADFEKVETHQDACRGVDRMIIIPPVNLSNLDCVDSLIHTTKQMGVTHTILLSIQEQLLTTAMGRKFVAWERILRENSYNYTVIRSSLFMDLILQIYDPMTKEVHHWLGDTRIFAVDPRDVGTAFATVAREGLLPHSGHTYTITGQQSISVKEMCETLGDILGFEVKNNPDVTIEGFRSKLAKHYSAYHIEEIVQIHQVIMNEKLPVGSNELIKLVGRYHPFKSFVEFHRSEFLPATSTS